MATSGQSWSKKGEGEEENLSDGGRPEFGKCWEREVVLIATPAGTGFYLMPVRLSSRPTISSTVKFNHIKSRG